MKKTKWTTPVMFVWTVLALLVPVGLIVGPLNLKYDERKKQAIALLLLSIFSVILWILHFSGTHH